MKRFLFVLPLLTLSIFVGCKLVFDTPASESFTSEYKIADGYKSINLDNEAGKVVVNTAVTDVITIEYTKKCMGTNDDDAKEHLNDIDISVSGSTSTGEVTITANFPDVDVTRNYEVLFTITMPDSIYLDIVNTTGDIEVTGMTRMPKLEATTGSIIIKGFECGVNAKTTTGDIDCSIDLLPSNENVTLQTTSGDNKLVISSMDTTHAINLDATEGWADITLPADVQLAFDMQVVTGEVRIVGYQPVYTEQSNKKAVGTIGDAATKSTLKVETETGDITLNKGS